MYLLPIKGQSWLRNEDYPTKEKSIRTERLGLVGREIPVMAKNFTGYPCIYLIANLS